MFRFVRLQQALRAAAGGGAAMTDEASAIEAQGLAPRLVEGSPFNIKVTRPEDLVLAEAILRRSPG
jgi:2-C-methyl-D-erythritol 4-phosphate cytidylyltransferase